MTINKEINRWNIREEVWSGAIDTLNAIAEKNKVGELMELLEELYPEGADMTAVNDLLWFEPEFLFEQLNIQLENEVDRTHKK